MAKKKGTRKKSTSGNPANRAKTTQPGPTRPLSKQPQRIPTSPATPARRNLEIRSAGPLAVLNRMPRWTIGVAVLVLGLLGVLLPFNWAGIFLILLAVFAGWLLALSWPVLNTGSRILRVTVIVIVVAFSLARMLGWAD